MLSLLTPVVLTGATVRMSGEDSSIHMNNAVLTARCGSDAGNPAAVTYIHDRDAGNGMTCSRRLSALVEYPSGLWVRAHLANVYSSCVGRSYSDTCAELPLEPCREPAWTCTWNPGEDPSTAVTTAPVPAEARNLTLPDGSSLLDVALDCRFPDIEQANTLWLPLPQRQPANLTVRLTVRHAGTELAWAGSPIGPVVVVPLPTAPPPPTPSPPPLIIDAATGGEMHVLTGGRMHVFTRSSTNRNFKVSTRIVAQILLVGGGGGCGYAQYHNGGGGAGGLVYAANFEIAPGTYSITIGAGGAGGDSNKRYGSNGEDTVAFGLTATGGGAGGHYSGASGVDHHHPGWEGGSGGGSGSRADAMASSTQNAYASISGVTGYGHAGGAGSMSAPEGSSQACGGGGGAGGPGTSGSSQSWGHGGIGRDYSSSFGSSVGDGGWFAGGGGGSCLRCTGAAGRGGKGGGGTGSATSGTDGMANTGGGCGASERGLNHGGVGYLEEAGKSGGSGIVIVKYLI